MERKSENLYKIWHKLFRASSIWIHRINIHYYSRLWMVLTLNTASSLPPAPNILSSSPYLLLATHEQNGERHYLHWRWYSTSTEICVRAHWQTHRPKHLMDSMGRQVNERKHRLIAIFYVLSLARFEPKSNSPACIQYQAFQTYSNKIHSNKWWTVKGENIGRITPIHTKMTDT